MEVDLYQSSGSHYLSILVKNKDKNKILHNEHSSFLQRGFTFIYFHISPKLDARPRALRFFCSMIFPEYNLFETRTGDDSRASSLEAELGTAPVSALGVVLDGVVGTEADPLGKGAVLPLLLGKSALGAEGLLGRLWEKMSDGGDEE